eukprot:scaffold8285_cov189-Cylindrotheca_fusiformis.AAC.1
MGRLGAGRPGVRHLPQHLQGCGHGQEVVGTGEVSRGRECNGGGGAFGLGVGDGRPGGHGLHSRIQWGH